MIVAMSPIRKTHWLSSSRPHDGSDGHLPKCPRCGGAVYRIRRNTLDRVLSRIAPVQRFKCRATDADLHCTWEGVIQIEDDYPNRADGRRSGQGNTPDSQAHMSITNVPGIFKNTVVPGHISFQDMARITLDSISDAVLVVNSDGQVIYLNKMAESMTGWTRKHALGKPVEDVFPIVDRKSRRRRIPPSQRAIDEDKTVELKLGSVLIRRDGSGVAIEDSATPVHNCDGRVTGAVIVFHDAGQSQAEIEKMSYLAQHDALTGLPNRTLLAERLTQALGMAKRNRKMLALLFVDLDHFKPVNDTLGHAIGDLLLRDVADNILACVRETDTVSRHGGDEFLVLLPEIEDLDAPGVVIDKLLARFQQPRTIGKHKLSVSLSIGVSVYPNDGLDADALLQKADAAMYENKDRNRKSRGAVG